MLNVDGHLTWVPCGTDGRTYERSNGRKLARLCRPAKAGATKRTKCFNFTFSKVIPSSEELKCAYNPISSLKLFF